MSEAFELLDSEFLQKNLGSTQIHFMDHSYSSYLNQNTAPNKPANNTTNTTSKNNNNKRDPIPEKPVEEGLFVNCFIFVVINNIIRVC